MQRAGRGPAKRQCKLALCFFGQSPFGAKSGLVLRVLPFRDGLQGFAILYLSPLGTMSVIVFCEGQTTDDPHS